MISCTQSPSNRPASAETAEVQTLQAVIRVNGMTCTGCEQTIAAEVEKLPGIDSVSASHTEGTAFVSFDSARVTLSQIQRAIEETGYQVVN